MLILLYFHVFFLLCIIVVYFFVFSLSGNMSLEAHDGEFWLHGEKVRLISGAMHYFRVVPEYWEDRMRRMKACGLNTLETYVFFYSTLMNIFSFKKLKQCRQSSKR